MVNKIVFGRGRRRQIVEVDRDNREGSFMFLRIYLGFGLK
jgi:hypothetical protein